MSIQSEQSINTTLIYNRALSSLSAQLGLVTRSGGQENRILMANELIEGAKKLDLCRAQGVLSHTFNGCVNRNVFAPPVYIRTRGG